MHHRPPEIEYIRALANGTVKEKLPKAPKPKARAAFAENRHEPGFLIKPGLTWVKNANKTPEAQMLFGEFWFQGELCILFADTNVGKSILAVQIGHSIAGGQPITPFRLDAEPCPVLYFDFELTEKQFALRYSDGRNRPFPLHRRFHRAVLNPASNKATLFGTYEQFITNEIENAILSTRSKVVIIDNVTCLRQGAQAAAGTINLVRGLQAIKNNHGLSMLVLAHTPKRNPVKPLTRNCLQGSKMLINFCDSAFAIGESHTVAGLRYLKQIKQRSTTEVYGAENVCLFSLQKPGNFLQAQFSGTGVEADHLLHFTQQHRRSRLARIAELHRQGLSLRQIAAEVHLSATSVFRILERLSREAEEGGCSAELPLHPPVAGMGTLAIEIIP